MFGFSFAALATSEISEPPAPALAPNSIREVPDGYLMDMRGGPFRRGPIGLTHETAPLPASLAPLEHSQAQLYVSVLALLRLSPAGDHKHGRFADFDSEDYSTALDGWSCSPSASRDSWGSVRPGVERSFYFCLSVRPGAQASLGSLGLLTFHRAKTNIPLHHMVQALITLPFVSQ